jgi:SAM-dependent methyltransferase
MERNCYCETYYEGFRQGSLAAATTMLPALFETVRPKSILDIGCGVGAWLRAAIDLGVEDVLGVDGSWVNPDQLMIPRDKFQIADLASGNWKPQRNFDLGLCMEVLEHIPDAAGRVVVKRLSEHTTIALISAAIPGQGGGGHNHINEQWQSYWAKIFEEHGFLASDALRRSSWAKTCIPYWYRQNAVIYASAEVLRNFRFLQTPIDDLDIVHPVLFRKRCLKKPKSKRLLSQLRKRLFGKGLSSARLSRAQRGY